MCFSPQRRAMFRHQNFKKCSDHAVFCAFWLDNVLLATALCIFSTSKLQKVLRPWGVLYIFTSKCASRQGGVQFLDIRTSKSAQAWGVLYIFTSNCAFCHSGLHFSFLCWAPTSSPARFKRPTFRLTRHTNHWKNTAFRDFSNIWRGCIFFLLTFALLHLLSADLTTLLCFQLSILSEVCYLNFLRQPPRIRDLLTGMILQVGKQILELFNRALVTSQTFFETTPKNATQNHSLPQKIQKCLAIAIVDFWIQRHLLALLSLLQNPWISVKSFFRLCRFPLKEPQSEKTTSCCVWLQICNSQVRWKNASPKMHFPNTQWDWDIYLHLSLNQPNVRKHMSPIDINP